jgi:hypothetical protein
VRQRETLRRALVAAAESLGWAALGHDPVDVAAKEVLTLAKAGARSVAEDLETELAAKKTELSRLRKAADSLHEMADEAGFEEPVEFSYAHTARQGDELVTKTQTVTLANGQEATDAADAIEKRLDGWDKLRGQMADELRRSQRQVEEMRHSLPDFTDSHRGLVREVLALLY